MAPRLLPAGTSHITMGKITISYWYEGSGVIRYAIKENKAYVREQSAEPLVQPKRWGELFSENKKPSRGSTSSQPVSATAACGLGAGLGFCFWRYQYGATCFKLY